MKSSQGTIAFDRHVIPPGAHVTITSRIGCPWRPLDIRVFATCVGRPCEVIVTRLAVNDVYNLLFGGSASNAHFDVRRRHGCDTYNCNMKKWFKAPSRVALSLYNQQAQSITVSGAMLVRVRP